MPHVHYMYLACPFKTILLWICILQVTTLINICERPSSIDVDLSSSGLEANVTDIVLPQDPFTNILTVNTTLTVLEDQRYTAVVSFSNLAGEFSNTIETNFGEIYKHKTNKFKHIYFIV